MDAELHVDLEPLAFLLGTWRGAGRGEYPTIESFEYEEELVFEHAGDAWLAYSQRSWAPEGEVLHWERGFLRPGQGGRVELVLAHPLGVVEVSHGEATDGGLRLSTEDRGAVGRTLSGLEVTGLTRRYQTGLDGRLAYELDMATETTPMTRHLVGELRRA